MRQRKVMNWKKDNILQQFQRFTFYKEKDKVSWEHWLKLDECSKSLTILYVHMKLI